MSIKAFVEKADAFVQVVQVINEHPISYHSLLSNTTLQFIPLPASKPRGALDQFFGVLFKVSQDPDIVIYPEHRPLLVPTINHFGGREGDPYMEQSGNTFSAGVTRVLTACSHLGFYPGSSLNLSLTMFFQGNK